MKTAVATAIALAMAALTFAPTVAQAADEAPLMSFRESFAEQADGPAAAQIDGRTVTNFQYVTAAAPYVRGGFLTTTRPDEADAGSYRIAHLGDDVTRVDATFAFSPHRRAGGVLCLSIQGSSIAEGRPVPVAPVHFVIGPEGWWLDVNTEQGTGVETLTAEPHRQRLVADGRTLYTAEIALDRATETVRLTLPDGSRRTFTNKALGLAGSYVYVEPFKNPGAGPAADQTDALVREWSADTAAVGDLGEAEVLPAPGEVVSPPYVSAPVALVTPVAPAAVPQPQHSAPDIAAPSVPTKVRAIQKDKFVVATWRGAADQSYRVRCGGRTVATDATKAAIRIQAPWCKVRSVTDAGTSPWVAVKVRRQR